MTDIKSVTVVPTSLASLFVQTSNNFVYSIEKNFTNLHYCGPTYTVRFEQIFFFFLPFKQLFERIATGYGVRYCDCSHCGT